LAYHHASRSRLPEAVSESFEIIGQGIGGMQVQTSPHKATLGTQSPKLKMILDDLKQFSSQPRTQSGRLRIVLDLPITYTDFTTKVRGEF
jgi:hypothetical protein